jgi:Fe-S-cluster-containing dehydrogenase component
MRLHCRHCESPQPTVCELKTARHPLGRAALYGDLLCATCGYCIALCQPEPGERAGLYLLQPQGDRGW